MNAYSEDFGRKTVGALRRGASKSQTARSFGVSRLSLERYAKMA
jgi:hypothetical protein